MRIGFADVRQKTLRLEGPLAGSGASFFVLQEEEDIFRLGDSAENGDDHFKDKAANQVHMLRLDTWGKCDYDVVVKSENSIL